MEKNGSLFFPNNQSATSMVSALQAAASIMKKSPASIPNNHIPFYPYVTPSNQHHTSQLSTNLPKMAPTSVVNPFSINDILSKTAVADCFPGNGEIEDFKFNQTPNSAANMATVENGFGSRSAAVAARAAAMLFNNHHGVGYHGNQQGQMKFTKKAQLICQDIPQFTGLEF